MPIPSTSPLPWTIEEELLSILINDANGVCIFEGTHTPAIKERLAHIVRCVNAHDALVEALDRIANTAELVVNYDGTKSELRASIVVAKDALAQAKGDIDLDDLREAFEEMNEEDVEATARLFEEDETP